MNNRDEFSKAMVITIGKRVGYICSNPNCKTPTAGAHEQDDKSVLIGEAAHITAAAQGGPRYNETLSHPERRAAANGIWLCVKCARLIDKDTDTYTTPLLQEWKAKAEDESRKILSGELKMMKVAQPNLQVDLTGWSRVRANKGVSYNNPIEYHEGQLVIVPGPKPIIHWLLWWKYTMVIYNHSTIPAFNVQVENISDVHLSSMQQLPDVNNIPPLDNKTTTIEYEYMIESRHDAADEMKKPRFPSTFADLKFKLTYQDEAGNNYVSIAAIDVKNAKVLTTKA